MSDEYHNSGTKDSLVNDSATQNYPPPGDTTSEGGYGSDPQKIWSDKAQRGNVDPNARPDSGLVDQSLSGGDLKNEIQDAKQGVDADTRRDFQGEGPSYDSRKDAQEMIDRSIQQS